MAILSSHWWRTILGVILILIAVAKADEKSCVDGYISFELITGFVFSSPANTLELKPGTLKLSDCLAQCKANDTCQSVNFETGLCVLFSSSAQESPNSLSQSQFPVFTLYAQKVCLFGRRRCKRDWMYERISGYLLRDSSGRHKTTKAASREQCVDHCLDEEEFLCRSANYDSATSECVLSSMDRHTVVGDKIFVPSGSESAEYLESNCVDDPARLCEFKPVMNKILKTVDAVFEDVKTLEECRKTCLNVPYRCHSFDMGDPANPVCRLSHHARTSLSHIREPYLEIAGSSTYELSSCYNVTISCMAREMVANVRTSKLFNGKVYAKGRPNSCVTDVSNSLEFEIRMAYHELDCDVKQENSGQFFNDIVIQHHDMIVTNQDLGLSVHCQYDLANRSVSNGVQLEVDGREIEASQSQLATVSSPNVTMRITDRRGQDLFAAQVGDALALRFEIVDPHSPYEIFVRELVAMDGVDSSEIVLIDSDGCPTDRTIMGSLQKVNGNGQILHAPFDAFKFPTSEIVQFKALVTPCLPTCEPAKCPDKTNPMYESRESDSFGRRRRRRRWTQQMSTAEKDNQARTKDDTAVDNDDEELVVVQTIHITDKFGFNADGSGTADNRVGDGKKDTLVLTDEANRTCVNVVGLVVASTLFLLCQLALLLIWACVWQRRRQRPKFDEDTPSIDILYTNQHRHHRSLGLPTASTLSSSSERHVFNNPDDITVYDVFYNREQFQAHRGPFHST